MSSESGKSNRGGGRFSSTQWSLVLAAGDSQDPNSREALATLCETYWYPIYALVRHLGSDPDRAQDLTQGFFTDLLERRFFKVAKPERGRFRSFLRTALRHYLANERKQAQAKKRGGGERPITLDVDTAESRYKHEPATGQTPEKLFEKRWAQTLLTRSLDRLREETRDSADKYRFSRLEPFLTGRPSDAGYRQVAGELQISESAVKVAVHRMRRRFGKLLRAEVAQTVSEPAAIDDEIRYLFSVIDS